MSEQEVEKQSEQVAQTIWHSRKLGMSWVDIRNLVEENHNVSITRENVIAIYGAMLIDMSQQLTPVQRAAEIYMEVERLNDLQEAWFPMALNQDKDAARIVLDVMKERHKLLGFDRQDATDKAVQQNVLIIGTDKEQWIESMMNGRNKPIMPGPAGDDGGDE